MRKRTTSRLLQSAVQRNNNFFHYLRVISELQHLERNLRNWACIRVNRARVFSKSHIWNVHSNSAHNSGTERGMNFVLSPLNAEDRERSVDM